MDAATPPPVSPTPAGGLGLTSAQAAQRLRADGYNELPSAERRSLRRILGEVLRQPMFALLIGGGAVYLLLGDRLEAWMLLLFATLSASISIVQEARSEKVLEALRNLASPRARVIRDGAPIQIAGRDVVVDDLLLLAEGDRVAADAELIDAQDLLLDESLLTGESLPVRKRACREGELGTAPSAPGGEDLPWLYSGTLVVRGRGRARVRATGARSELGRVGHALAGINTEQPRLQREIARLVRAFALLGAVAGSLVVLLYGLLHDDWLQALLGGIALGMSLLPEEFPLVMAVFMAMGAWRISRARVLTRRAAAIETLGATTVLCSDKTGTLTENRMSVASLIRGEHAWRAGALPADLREALRVACAACPPESTDPMDLALGRLAAAEALPANPLQRLHGYGLGPDLLAVTELYRGADGQLQACAKGAVEHVLGLCEVPVAQRDHWLAQAEALAARGQRVLGLARAEVPASASTPALPASPRELPFAFVGLVAFADPLRAQAKAAVAECRSAGIRVLMITGDYPATAASIAAEAGIASPEVLSGAQIEAMDDDALAHALRECSVFARIRPQQKLRLVECLKRGGEVVAMTGDGVNDAPALKAAHIGVAMGGRGTDVAREASSLVLLDDDFGSIVATVRLGRRIYDNLRKAIEYIVAVHIPIAGLALLPLLFGLPMVLTPVHIAFLEMIIDPACSVVFEAEPEEDDLMRRPPRSAGSALLDRRRLRWALSQGLLVLAVLAALLTAAHHAGVAEAETRALVFVALVAANLALIVVNRSFRDSLPNALRRPNRAFVMLAGGVLALLAVVLGWPAARGLFHFGRLDATALALGLGCGLLCLLILESAKAFARRRSH